MKQILYVFYLLPLFCFSQETITISGYMEEKETGEKLIGATIYDLKSQKGTITNDYGFFSLTIPKDSIHLKVSYIGFKPQFYLGSPKSDITFNFKMESIMLDEVEILSDKDEQVHLKTEMSTIDLSMQKVKTLPALLGENDIMRK